MPSLHWYDRHATTITQVIVLLTAPPEGTVIETAFVAGSTRHEYQVLPIWEQAPEIFLNDVALLPFASLAATTGKKRRE